MKKPAKLTPVQSEFLRLLGARFVFYWGAHFSISHADDTFRHGYYDEPRYHAIRGAGATTNTVWSLIKRGELEQVARFAADATGRWAYIYRSRRAVDAQPSDS